MTRRTFITNLTRPIETKPQPQPQGDHEMVKRNLSEEEFREANNHANAKVRRKAHKDNVKDAGASRSSRDALKRSAPVEAEEGELDLVELMQGGTLQRAFCSSFQNDPFDPSGNNDW